MKNKEDKIIKIINDSDINFKPNYDNIRYKIDTTPTLKKKIFNWNNFLKPVSIALASIIFVIAIVAIPMSLNNTKHYSMNDKEFHVVEPGSDSSKETASDVISNYYDIDIKKGYYEEAIVSDGKLYIDGDGYDTNKDATFASVKSKMSELAGEEIDSFDVVVKEDGKIYYVATVEDNTIEICADDID